MGSRIQQLLWGQDRNSSFTPGPPGLKQPVQDLSLKISWGCLGVRLGLFLDLNLSVSGPVLLGTQLAQSLCFPTFLLPSLPGPESPRVCLGSCQCASMKSQSLGV